MTNRSTYHSIFVGYIVGLAKNPRLNALASGLLSEAKERFESTGQKQRLFAEVHYAALSWDRPRRVLAKAEYSSFGSQPNAWRWNDSVGGAGPAPENNGVRAELRPQISCLTPK